MLLRARPVAAHDVGVAADGTGEHQLAGAAEGEVDLFNHQILLRLRRLNDVPQARAHVTLGDPLEQHLGPCAVCRVPCIWMYETVCEFGCWVFGVSCGGAVCEVTPMLSLLVHVLVV